MAALKRFALAYSRNPAAGFGLLLLIAIIAMALTADWFFPRDPLSLAGRPLQWPGANPRFPLGTDNSGRDIAAQIFHGARVSLLIGLVATSIAVAIGIVIGALAGYYGGVVDDVLMRPTEAFQTLPNFLLLLVLVSIFGSELTTVVVAIGVVSWPATARLTRAEFLTLRNREFVQACRGLGMGDGRIIFREILPNVLPPVIVLVSFTVASAILFEAMLAFLGFSDPDLASWGRLVGEGRQSLRTSWYISAIPGLVIMLAVMALNFIGDGLNDALDPRGRRQ